MYIKYFHIYKQHILYLMHYILCMHIYVKHTHTYLFEVGFLVCLVAQTVKNSPAMQEICVRFLGQEIP